MKLKTLLVMNNSLLILIMTIYNYQSKRKRVMMRNKLILNMELMVRLHSQQEVVTVDQPVTLGAGLVTAAVQTTVC